MKISTGRAALWKSLIMGKVYTMCNGFSLEYNEWGQAGGVPLVCVPGLLGGFPVDMAAYAGPLRIIELKRSGYGKSSLMKLRSVMQYAANIQEFLDALCPGPFCVLAHSAGAPFALAMAAHLPQRVRAVGITSGVPECYKDEIIKAAPFPGRVRMFYFLCRTLPLYFLGKWFCGFVKKIRAQHGDALKAIYAPALLEQILADALRNGGQGMAETARTQGMCWGFAMQDIAQKVFWHHSRSDGEVPYACAEKTWRHLHNVAVTTYATESHSAQKMFLNALHDVEQYSLEL